MIRPAGLACHRPPRARRGFTLVEVLVATTLTLMLMGAVVTMFQMVSNSVSDSRSALEMSQALRSAATQLQRDLSGVTVTMLPPRRPENNEGYFEFVENSILEYTLSRGVYRVLPTTQGASTPSVAAAVIPVNIQAGPSLSTGEADYDDLTVADHDDILMFTTRTLDRPFVGRYGNLSATSTTNTIESQVAEVAWFVRGRTLYRRQLLIVPNLSLPSNVSGNPRGFYGSYDLSVHLDPTRRVLVPNSLGDLTKREFRFAHPCLATELVSGRVGNQHRPPFPYDIRYWGAIRLPTLAETSSSAWLACQTFPSSLTTTSPGVRSQALPTRTWEDLWTGSDGIIYENAGQINAAFTSANQYRVSNPYHRGYLDNNALARSSDDVMLTNVLGFDVKVWDPGAPLYLRSVRGRPSMVVAPGDAGYPSVRESQQNLGRMSRQGYGAFVDLGYLPNCPTPPSGAPRPQFHVVNWDVNNGPQSRLQRTYDTWSTHYESDGIAQYNAGKIDTANDGFDNDGRNGVDDAGERETQPPYPYPLRSIQVKIRTFDPDSRQIRETTIVQDFLPK